MINRSVGDDGKLPGLLEGNNAMRAGPTSLTNACLATSLISRTALHRAFKLRCHRMFKRFIPGSDFSITLVYGVGIRR